MDNKEKVLGTFVESDTMLDAKGVAELTGIEKSEVSKLISALKKEGLLLSPKRCYYQAAK